jgi:hypothetical protein
MEIEMLMQGVDREFLSYSVPFQASRSDADSENYYMEREWRNIGDIQFTLEDICRIIIPRKWTEQLRLVVPEYSGQVSFSG